MTKITNKANIVFLKNVQYIENSKIYKSDECILKEEFCNTEIYCKNNMIENISLDNKIELDFDRTEYFKVNTDLMPWSYTGYLRCFNNLNIDIDPAEIETEDDMVLSCDDKIDDILVCFQTKAVYGVYKTVMKYNLFALIKEIDCDLWAPLDIRKPFKLVKKCKTKDNRIPRKLKAIGEIKQEQSIWYIYHPFQLRCTLSNIEKEKENVDLIKNDFLKSKSKQALTDNCKKLKEAFFDEEYDILRFLDDYPQFW